MPKKSSVTMKTDTKSEVGKGGGIRLIFVKDIVVISVVLVSVSFD